MISFLNISKLNFGIYKITEQNGKTHDYLISYQIETLSM